MLIGAPSGAPFHFTALLYITGGEGREAMPRKISQNRGNPQFRNLPARRQDETTGTLPCFADCERWPVVVDLLLRQRIYVAAWAGADGAVAFVDVLNGADRRRYTVRDDAELRELMAALHEEFTN